VTLLMTKGAPGWIVVKVVGRCARDDIAHNIIDRGRYRLNWPLIQKKERKRNKKKTTIILTPLLQFSIIYFSCIQATVTATSVFVIKYYIVIAASILYTFLELHACNIDQIICAHVSLTADEISHGVNVYIR